MLESIKRQEINPRELDDLMLAQEIKRNETKAEERKSLPVNFIKSSFKNSALAALHGSNGIVS